MITHDFHQACAASLIRTAKSINELEAPEARCVELPYSSFRDGFPAKELRDITKWAGKRSVIYTFVVLKGKPSDALLQEFIRAKVEEYKRETDSKKRRAFAQENRPSETLYAGSSNDLGARLKQHFGERKTTYSMQLRHWISTSSIEQLQIKVWRYQYLDSGILQVIEDQLWDSLKPMLGKRGGK